MGVIVISRNNSFTRTIQETLDGNTHPLSCHAGFADARPPVASGFFNWCVVDADQGLRQAVTDLQQMGAVAENCRWIAVAERATSAEIEYACENGFFCVLPKPLQPNLLKPLFLPTTKPHGSMPTQSVSPQQKPPRHTEPNLDAVRSFSRILSQSENLPKLIEQFILKVRELAGVNRIAIFLERPVPTGSPLQNRLQHVCSIGIPADIRDILELSRSSGIGGWVTRNGQILQIELAAEILPPEELLRTQREFNILGCEIAIPITDRERTIGVAMLGGHLTRSGFSDEELQLFFHLMEELGLSIKNNWLHQKLATSHRLLHDVLASMKNGSLVIGPELEIRYANPAIIRFLLGETTGKPQLVFADLPPAIAEKVHALTERGTPTEPFILQVKNDSLRTYRVTVIPFPDETGSLPQSAMLLMEDLAETNLPESLTATPANKIFDPHAAKRLAEEIQKSLAPLNSHLQLLNTRDEESDLQLSLQKRLQTETGRISRLVDQMAVLSGSRQTPSTIADLEKLLRQSFDRAQMLTGFRGILAFHNNSGVPALHGDPDQLQQAFQEIFINSLQTHPAPEILVSIEPDSSRETETICIDFVDNGEGFSEEALEQALEPFYTSRETCLGLGLTVASLIAKAHGGRLEIPMQSSEAPTRIRLYLSNHQMRQCQSSPAN